MNLITCENVSFRYENQLVTEGLNFTVKEGDYVCVVGENGSGKSTLMKGLLGLKKPSSGYITMGDGLKKSDIGYLPQQMPAQKDFPASCFEIVLSGCLNHLGFHPFYTKKDKELAFSYMESLGIFDLKRRCYRELSGGQQQRVLLARALCAAKKVILLDEPVSGLDPKATFEFYEVLRKVRERHNLAIVMVSHDIHAAVGEAEHILHLARGGYFFGTKEEYETSQNYQSFHKNQEVEK